MIDFVKKGGVYKDTPKRILCHKFHCKFLGNDIALKMFRKFVARNPGTTLLTNRDYYERYQPSPEGEFQSEHFGKHQSVSLEGCE